MTSARKILCPLLYSEWDGPVGVLLSSCLGHKRAAKGFGALRDVFQLSFKKTCCVNCSLLSPKLGGIQTCGGFLFLTKVAALDPELAQGTLKLALEEI